MAHIHFHDIFLTSKGFRSETSLLIITSNKHLPENFVDKKMLVHCVYEALTLILDSRLIVEQIILHFLKFPFFIFYDCVMTSYDW